jgi:hypothetical protein
MSRLPKNLPYLLGAPVQASFPVECRRRPGVSDSGAAHVSYILEPAP